MLRSLSARRLRRPLRLLKRTSATSSTTPALLSFGPIRLNSYVGFFCAAAGVHVHDERNR